MLKRLLPGGKITKACPPSIKTYRKKVSCQQTIWLTRLMLMPCCWWRVNGALALTWLARPGRIPVGKLGPRTISPPTISTSTGNGNRSLARPENITNSGNRPPTSTAERSFRSSLPNETVAVVPIELNATKRTHLDEASLSSLNYLTKHSRQPGNANTLRPSRNNILPGPGLREVFPRPSDARG